MRPRLRAIVALILLAAPASAPAQTAPPPTLPCRIAADHSWTPQEQVAWARICGDQVANFNIEPGYGGAIDLRDGWLPDNRVLSRKFIETILTDEKYRGAIKRHGVRFAGARFTQPIDLQNVKLDNELWFDQCLFDVGVDLSWLQSAQPVGFSRSTVTGYLNFYAAQLASDLQLTDSVIDEVRLDGAHVGHTLALTGSTVADALEMPGIDVGVDLLMKDGEYKDVSLVGARVAHALNMTNSHFTDALAMSNLQVGTDLQMASATFADKIDLRYSQIGGELDWRGASFSNNVELTAAHVGGAFLLGSPRQGKSADHPGPATWSSPNVTLTARYAKIGVIPRLSDAWPGTLHIVGLIYDGIAEVGDDFYPWFAKQTRYSRQPYEQLATVLQGRGEIETATAVRHAERERDRDRAYSEGRWDIYFWLTLLWAVIGYGYYPYLSLIWVAVFVGIGVFVLRVSGEGRRNHMPYGFSYSFDLLLPIIQLRQEHYAIDLNGWARYYFYIHKIAGWALATFLVAGLSGLTK
jgi:hypothetical protein